MCNLFKVYDYEIILILTLMLILILTRFQGKQIRSWKNRKTMINFHWRNIPECRHWKCDFYD